MDRNKGYKTLISDWSRINQTNIVLRNASLHHLSKTTKMPLVGSRGLRFSRRF